jgi:hypothetical protein
MGIDPELWRKNIKDDLDWLSDEDHQRRVWAHNLSDWDFPDEAVYSLGDHAFAEFIDAPEIGLNPAQKAKAREFKAVFDRFLEERPAHLEGAWLVDDPRWVHIRKLARELLDML